MRVLCDSLDEFIEDLNNHDAIVEDVIRFSTVHEDHPTNDLIESVYAQATALVFSKQPGFQEYLLQVGLSCGQNYSDAEENAGTQTADKYRNQLKEYAESRGWRLGSGVVTY